MLSVFCKFSRNNLQRITTREQLQAAFLLSFHSIRTPHDSSESAWTAWKKTPTSGHTPCLPTSVDLATGKAHGSSVVNKAMCISKQIRQAHLGLFWFFNVNRIQ